MDFSYTYAVILLGYLLGSIPTAVWVSRAWHGKDVREIGSGNAGSTNTYRAFGWKAGAVVQVVDILKGALAVLIPLLLGLATQVWYLAALAAVVGHIYPVFAGFKGGKGMNTLLGAFLLLDWQASLVAVGVFGLVLYLGSMVSLASMLAVASLPITLYVRGLISGEKPETLVQLLAVGFPLLILYTHRSNVGRIRKGAESRVGFGLNPPKAAGK